MFTGSSNGEVMASLRKDLGLRPVRRSGWSYLDWKVSVVITRSRRKVLCTRERGIVDKNK